MFSFVGRGVCTSNPSILNPVWAQQETEQQDNYRDYTQEKSLTDRAYSLPFHWLCAPGLALVQLHSRFSRRAHRLGLRCTGIRSLHRAAREHEVRHLRRMRRSLRSRVEDADTLQGCRRWLGCRAGINGRLINQSSIRRSGEGAKDGGCFGKIRGGGAFIEERGESEGCLLRLIVKSRLKTGVCCEVVEEQGTKVKSCRTYACMDKKDDDTPI